MAMFCPQCGQERVSMDTNYCSRCGFLLTGTTELLNSGGVIPLLRPQTGFKAGSPRNQGLKQGLFILLLTFLIVPLIVIITVAQRAEPYVAVVASILLVVGGLLRMAYALMFESTVPGGQSLEDPEMAGAKGLSNRTTNVRPLPSQHSYPVSAYVSPATGNWRDTNDLEPASVTDSTTKLLEKDETDQ